MPFTQPGSTTGVVSVRFWILFGCKMLHVLKILCRDHVLCVSLVLECNLHLHTARIQIGPTRMHMHSIYTSLDLTEVDKSEFYVQQLVLEIIKLIRTHT